MELPKKLKAKKAIINVQNRDEECLRWAIKAALFPPPPGVKVTRTSSYPTEDGLDFTGIDFQHLFHRLTGWISRIGIWLLTCLDGRNSK